MKKTRILFLLLLPLLLTSCFGKSSSSSTVDANWQAFYQQEKERAGFQAPAVNEISKTSCAPARSFAGSFTGAELKIMMINDNHGSLSALDKTAAYLIGEKANNPYSITIGNGDLFQGTAASNIYLGRPVVDFMNCVGFDAMVIGNHEFDWGVETMTNLVDGNAANGEAEFPLLGANITSKQTGQKVSWLESSRLVNLNGLKVGIIGGIGDSLESSIAVSRIQDYSFTDLIAAVSDTESLLRAQGADIVIASVHEGSGSSCNNSVNSSLASLNVDAILNAHSHQIYSCTINGKPIIQAGANNQLIGEISLTISSSKNVIDSSIDYVDVSYLSSSNNYVREKIALYEQAIAPYYGEVLGTAGESVYSTNNVGPWVADTMKRFTGADVALVNTAGLRTNTLPILNNQQVTLSDMVGISPFDNYIKSTTVSGSELTRILNFICSNRNSYFFPMDTFVSSTSVQVGGETISASSNAKYTIVTVDYVFDSREVFYSASNQENHGVILSDLMRLDIKYNAFLGKKWVPSQGAILGKKF